VNASPSVTADTQLDYDLKHAMLNDVFDIADMEKKYDPHMYQSTMLIVIGTKMKASGQKWEALI
jgi:hypothetical protein